MMTEYYLCDPTKNITALITTPTEIADQSTVAGRIMKKEPTCEQAGFVRLSADGVKLRMAGGEFCGNAAMSAAALWCSEFGKDRGRVTSEISGADRPLSISVKKLDDGEYACSVPMPAVLSAEEAVLDGYAVTRVDMNGIVHLVTEEKLPDAAAETLVKRWCGLYGADALGLMQLDGDSLKPLVYVPGADTLFWESSCASGTAAVGAYLFVRSGKSVRRSIIQPGGVLTVDVSITGDIILSGKVRMIKKDSISI